MRWSRRRLCTVACLTMTGVRVLEVVIEPEAHEPGPTHQASHRTAAPVRWTGLPRRRTIRTPIVPEPANDKPGLRTRRGDRVRKLPDQVWKLPRYEDDEAAAEQGIGRILALWTVGSQERRLA